MRQILKLKTKEVLGYCFRIPKAEYIYQDSKLLAYVACFAELVETAL
jgi:hypothetical protein